MKIKPEHLETLRGLIQPILDSCPVEWYKSIHPEYSSKRIRWEYFYAAGQLASSFLCDTLYSYMNDDHMDTALKQIVGE
jgi:hypothetical protein